MKKIILLLTGVVLSVASFAQLSFGLQGTGNLGTATVKYEDFFDFRKTARAMPGAGVVIQYAINKNLSLRSGVNYLQNGVVLKTTVDESVDMRLELQNNLDYVQVPVNLLFTLPVSRFQFFVGGGGFVSYGVGGKSKATLSYTMPDGEQSVVIEEVKAFKKEEDGGAGLKRTDYGVSALAGLRLGSGLFANVGYQLSLANISGADENKYKNRGLQLTIGYFF